MANTGIAGLEKTNELFTSNREVEGVPPSLDTDAIPDNLKRAALRMQLPPSYVVVGIYRLFTDEHLWRPTWDKCKHGVQRGAIVGAIWVRLRCLFYCVSWSDGQGVGFPDFWNPREVHSDILEQVSCSFHIFELLLTSVPQLSQYYRSRRRDCVWLSNPVPFAYL